MHETMLVERTRGSIGFGQKNWMVSSLEDARWIRLQDQRGHLDHFIFGRALRQSFSPLAFGRLNFPCIQNILKGLWPNACHSFD